MPSKRELIEPTPGDKRYVRRSKTGQFKNVVDVGRSLAADQRSKSSTAVKPGQGDKGDVVRSGKAVTRKSTSKKSSVKKAASKKPASKAAKRRSSPAKKK